MSNRQTPEETSAAFLAAALAASVCHVRKAHLLNLQIALADIEATTCRLADLCELVEALTRAEDGEVPPAALRALVPPLRVQADGLLLSFNAAHAEFVALRGEGAAA